MFFVPWSVKKLFEFFSGQIISEVWRRSQRKESRPLTFLSREASVCLCFFLLDLEQRKTKQEICWAFSPALPISESPSNCDTDLFSSLELAGL